MFGSLLLSSYWSMPQGSDKSDPELIEFQVMLPNINLLYLFCDVLILLDMSYMSRFWYRRQEMVKHCNTKGCFFVSLISLVSHRRTQFEAFLSMRSVTADGLSPAPESDRRCAVRCIHSAPIHFEQALFGMWASKTAQEAYDVLVSPDIEVTNKGDKRVQLPKLLKLNEFTKEVVAEGGGRPSGGSHTTPLSLELSC